MMKLIKMELYKLRTSKMFIISMSVCFAVNAIILALVPVITRLLDPDAEITKETVAEQIANPFSVGLMAIVIFISAVSFLSLDFSGGYIKNIAGQTKNRGDIVMAKIVAVGVHNLIFYAVGALSNCLGYGVMGQLAIDGDILGGVLTLLLKWLLSLAICAILTFIAVGLTAKTFAIVMAILFSTGTFSLLYSGIDVAISSSLKINDFQLSRYMPDTLIGNVSILTDTLVVNSLIVSAVFIAVFILLSCIVFKKRDVK